MRNVVIDGITYVPRASIPELTDDRLLGALGSIMEILYFDEKHKARGIAFNALKSLAPDLYELACDSVEAAHDRVQELGDERKAAKEEFENKEPASYTRETMLQQFEVVLKDLKHNIDPAYRIPSNANIRRELYKGAIRDLYSDSTFMHTETELSGLRQGLYIKGYVKDVWGYLESAYDLIHTEDFEAMLPKSD